jgi:ribosomal RNA-processing protein 1
VSTLSKWLAANKDLERVDYLKVWKGLFYCFWLCDKPKPQHELAEIISEMICEVRSWKLFLETFWETMAREWPGIDRWRVNKYYNFFRCMLKSSASFVLDDEEKILSWIEIFQNGPLNPLNEKLPMSIQLSVVEKFIPELFQMKPKENHCYKMLSPFYNLLEKTKHFNVVDRLVENVFEPILSRAVTNESYEEQEVLEIHIFDTKDVFQRLVKICESSDFIFKHKKRVIEVLALYSVEIDIELDESLRAIIKPPKRTLPTEKFKKNKK